MRKHSVPEHRANQRKELYVPIKLSVKDGAISNGHMLNINCYGLKAEIMLKTTEDEPLMDKVLSAQNIILEVGRAGGKIHLSAAVDVIWSRYRYGEGEKIYEVGFALKLNQEQQQEWRKFYEGL